MYSECQRMQKILGSDEPCEMQLIGDIKELNNTYVEIFVAFIVVLLFLLPTGYYLAMMSLRPIHESIETIDSFINGIVHDINTPLSVIKLNAQSMQLQIKDERLAEQNARVLQGIADVESLEEQLLFSLKADRYVLSKSRFNLHELLKSRLAFYNDIRDSVLVNLKGYDLHVNADSAILTRMIDNIVLNAIKFSSRNSQVKITLNEGLLSIKDQGIGIKHPKEIFTKYYREDLSKQSLGLGLFIVASVAELHQLDVVVKSKINVGTEFIIDLKNIKVI